MERKGREGRLTIFLYIDFSDNLMVSVKYEPQSLHWSHEQITAVHSGILKDGGDKSYHAYLSDDKQHDQKLIKLVIKLVIKLLIKLVIK